MAGHGQGRPAGAAARSKGATGGWEAFRRCYLRIFWGGTKVVILAFERMRLTYHRNLRIANLFNAFATRGEPQIFFAAQHFPTSTLLFQHHESAVRAGGLQLHPTRATGATSGALFGCLSNPLCKIETARGETITDPVSLIGRRQTLSAPELI
jgi:hypothetical protein